MTQEKKPLIEPPPLLHGSPVSLRFAMIVPGDPGRGFVPFYHFRMVLPDSIDAGHINLRVGDTNHVLLYAGHIGYMVYEEYRGHSLAYHACRTLSAFARQVSPSLIITCDPDNQASIRTIEKLGAAFIEEIPVPPTDPHYARGSRFKRRYKWELKKNDCRDSVPG